MRKISFQEINKIAIPSMLAGIAEPLIGLADTAIIGNMPENATESLGAVGLGAQFFLFVFWIFIQTEASLSSIIAKALGKNEEKKEERLIGQGLMLNFGIGILLFLLTNFFIEGIFNLYQAKGLVRELAIEYYSIRSIGFPIALCTWMIWGVFRGLQNTSWAMTVGIGGGVLNLILDLVLIYGIDGFIEPMGVKGAALGSLISQVFMLIASIIILYRKTIFRLIFSFKLHEKFQALIGTSSDFIIRAISLNVVLFLSNSFATKYGKEEIAAHSIALQLWLFSAFLMDGYANAGQAISGKLSGNKNWLGIEDLTSKLLKVSFVISAIMMLVFALGRTELGTWFSDDMEVIEIFNTIMIYVILCQPINGMAFTFDGILKGILATGFIRNMMIASGMIFVIILFLLDYWLPGIHAIWIGLAIWMLGRSIAPYLYLKKKFKNYDEPQ